MGCGIKNQLALRNDEEISLDQICTRQMYQKDKSHSFSMSVLQPVGRALTITEISESDVETNHDL